jgi:hypothetical protein
VTATLVVLPWVLVCALFGSFGMLMTDTARVATAVAIEQAVVVLLAVMAASVTSSLTHLIVAGVAGSTLVTMFNLILLPVILTTWPFVGESMIGAGPDVYIATLFVLGIPAIAHQYFTLREWRTATLVACALLGATIVTRAWPPTVLAAVEHPVDRSVINPAAVTAAIDPETMTFGDRNQDVAGVDIPSTWFAGVLTADGEPDDVLLTLTGIDSRLMLPDQTVSYQSAMNQPRALGPRSRDGRSQNTRALQAALGPSVRLFEPLSLQGARAINSIVVVNLPTHVSRRHAGTRAILTADVTLQAYRYRVRDTRPARHGVRFAFAGSGIEVTSVSTSKTGASVLVREADVWSHGQALWWAEHPATSVFVVRNLARREAFELRYVVRGRSPVLTLNIRRTAPFVSTGTWLVPASPDADQRRIDDAWLAGAEIVRLELENLGTFERPLQAEFTMKK